MAKTFAGRSFLSSRVVIITDEQDTYLKQCLRLYEWQPEARHLIFESNNIEVASADHDF